MRRCTLLLALIFLNLIVNINLFSQNQRVDGYKGLWFSAGQLQEYGYRFSGGSATFGSQHRPVAIYSPESKKTFFVYGGTTVPDERHLLIMVSYFDHKLNMVPKPVVVYDKMGVREPFDNPSLSIDENGYIWVFVSGRDRTRPGLIFKSTKPYSIDSFEKILTMEMIAPQPWWIKDKGFMLIFLKNLNGHEIYFATSSDGVNWSEHKKLAGMGGHFQLSAVNDKKVVTAFTSWTGSNSDKQTAIYIVETEDMGNSWTTLSGKPVSTPLNNPDNEALIKNLEPDGKYVYLCDMNFDRDNNPVLLVVISSSSEPGPQGKPREWFIMRWQKDKWYFIKVCESDNNHDSGSLIITDESWFVVGPTEPGPLDFRTGGDIATWISSDEGKTWRKAFDLTRSTVTNHSFVKRPVDAHREFSAFWSDGEPDRLSPCHLYFTNQKLNRVWMLPYDMAADLQKPVRIR